MRGNTESAMRVDATIGIGFASCGQALNAAKPFKNEERVMITVFLPVYEKTQ